MVVTLPGSSGEIAAYLTAVLYQWQENLGAEVEVRQLDGDAYFDRLDEEKDDVFFYGWSADYPDPQDFLDVLFRSGSVNNVGRVRQCGLCRAAGSGGGRAECRRPRRTIPPGRGQADRGRRGLPASVVWKELPPDQARGQGVCHQPAGVSAAGQRVGVWLGGFPSAREWHETVQQNAAGSLRVSLNPSFFDPPRVGVRGLKESQQQAYST